MRETNRLRELMSHTTYRISILRTKDTFRNGMGKVCNISKPIHDRVKIALIVLRGTW